MNSLENLLVDQLKDLYDAELRITKALPKMVKAATTAQLKAAFQQHLQQTEEQVSRLEKVFELFGQKPKKKKCEAIVGLLAEGQEIIKTKMEPVVKDAALIVAAQKVEHYEIAGYGSVRTWAELLKNKEVAKLLQATLKEEGETDKKLTQLAKKLNIKALKA